MLSARDLIKRCNDDIFIDSRTEGVYDLKSLEIFYQLFKTILKAFHLLKPRLQLKTSVPYFNVQKM